jgi:hypothetical protein
MFRFPFLQVDLLVALALLWTKPKDDISPRTSSSEMDCIGGKETTLAFRLPFVPSETGECTCRDELDGSKGEA